MNKKGIITVAFFFAGLFALILGYIILSSPDKEGKEEAIIGEKQAALVQFYLDGEEILLNIEEAARLAQAKAMQDLYKSPGCNKKEGYIILEDCMIDKNQLETQFITFLQNNLGGYLGTVREEYSIALMPEDYTFTIKEGSLEGATERVISKGKEGIEYSFRPNFKIQTNLSIEQVFKTITSLRDKKECLVTYNELEGEKKLIERCDLQEFDIWKIKKKGDSLFFDVTKSMQSLLLNKVDAQVTISLKTR